MNTEKYILLSTYTRYSKIESAFVQELFEHDLIVPKPKTTRFSSMKMTL